MTMIPWYWIRQLIARRANNLGIASVKWDSSPATQVDLYSSSTLNQQVVYSVYGLTPGTHTLPSAAAMAPEQSILYC